MKPRFKKDPFFPRPFERAFPKKAEKIKEWTKKKMIFKPVRRTP